MMKKGLACTVHAAGAAKIAIVAGVGVLGLGLTMGGAYASLNATATNTTAQAVSSGTLKLIMGDNGAGFTQAITNVAPNDVINRYVDLTNSGTINGQALTLGVTDSTATKLTTDATNGLKLTVTACTGATWTPATATCGAGGTTTAILSNVALSTMTSTPVTIVSGALAAGSVMHLQFSLALPNQTETVVNGVLPGGTIQGLSSALTWSFNEVQRAGTTTNS